MKSKFLNIVQDPTFLEILLVDVVVVAALIFFFKKIFTFLFYAHLLGLLLLQVKFFFVLGLIISNFGKNYETNCHWSFQWMWLNNVSEVKSF